MKPGAKLVARRRCPSLTFWHEPKAAPGVARWHSLPLQHLELSTQPNLVRATHCKWGQEGRDGDAMGRASEHRRLASRPPALLHAHRASPQAQLQLCCMHNEQAGTDVGRMARRTHVDAGAARGGGRITLAGAAGAAVSQLGAAKLGQAHALQRHMWNKGRHTHVYAEPHTPYAHARQHTGARWAECSSAQRGSARETLPPGQV